MEYRPLGRTGVQVSKLCLGTMMFGAWGNSDHDDSTRIIHAALDAGINFVDSADVYSAGASEEIVGKAFKGRRDHVVLATKFWGTMGDDPNAGAVSRRWIVAEVENSLRRLGHRLDRVNRASKRISRTPRGPVPAVSGEGARGPPPRSTLCSSRRGACFAWKAQASDDWVAPSAKLA